MTTIETKTRKLGSTDVFPIGLGAMPMALSGRPPEEQSIRAIHAALDAGVNLIDTADAYARDRRHQGRPHPARRRLGARRPPRAHP